MTTRTEALTPGTRVGRYVLERPLGEGGMGRVYAARDEELDRTVAIKLVQPRQVGALESRDSGPIVLSAADAAARGRQIAEARAMARVSHRGVVTVYDAGAFDELIFIAMELIDGETLRSWLSKTPRVWREVAARFVAAGRGLAAAHAAGIVHGDFKPDNVLIDAYGRVCVADFGLARDGADPVAMMAGTLPYVSPEQHLGRGGDKRSDQWSFCVAFWEGLFGARPFVVPDDSTRPKAVLFAAATTAGRIQPPPAAARVPRWLRAIVERGLAVDPGARWPSMSALLDACEVVPRRRRRLAVGAAALTFIGAAVATTAIVSRAGDPCAGTAAELATVWTPQTRAGVAAALASNPRRYAPVVAERAVVAIDGWAAGWRAQRQKSCRATVRGEVPAPDAANIARCLDDQLVTLRARVALLSGPASPEILDLAHELAHLPAAASCTRAPPDVLPDDPGQRRVVESFRSRLAELDAKRIASKAREIQPAAESLAVEAAALARPLDLARALLLTANIDSALSRYDRAAQRARAAAAAFTAGGDDRAAAAAWQQVLNTLVVSRNRDGIDATLAAARGAVARAGDRRDQVFQTILEAQVDDLRGDRERALAGCLAARDLARRELGPDDVLHATCNRCLGDAYQELGRFYDGLRVAEENLRFTEARFPAGHMALAGALHTFAAYAANLGRRTEALAASQRELAIVRENLGDSIALAMLLRNIALIEIGDGKDEAALNHAEEALAMLGRLPQVPPGRRAAIESTLAQTLEDREPARADVLYGQAIARYEALDPPEDRKHAFTLLNRAQHLAAIGGCDRSIPLAEKAGALLRSIRGGNPGMEALAHAILTDCHHRRHRHDLALATAEAGLALVRDDPVTADLTATLEFQRARARWELGRDRPTALAEAQLARDAYVTANGPPKQLADIDGWIARAAARRTARSP